MTILYPSSNVSVECTPSTGTNYACVDETVLDVADYNSLSSLGGGLTVGMDEFEFTDYSGNADLAKITVFAYANGINTDTVGYCKIKFHVNIGGTRYYNDEYFLSASILLYSYSWTVSPATTVAWTKTEVNGLKVGYTLTVYGYTDIPAGGYK
jgi:hypothetical protein